MTSDIRAEGVPVVHPAQANARRLQAAAALIAAVACFAATTLIAKALGGGMFGMSLHPFQISAGRFGFALLILAPIVLYVRPRISLAMAPTHAARALSGWAGATCLFAAAAAMPLAAATAIGFLSPVFTMLFAARFLGERVGGLRWSAAMVAFAGVLVLTVADAGDLASASFSVYGPAIALAAAAFIGIEVIFIKRLTRGERPLSILAVNNLLGAAIACVAAAFVWQAPSLTMWACLAALGGVMALGQFLFLLALRRADASFAAPFSYGTLAFAALYDFGVFGVAPSLIAWGGMGLIVAAAMCLAWRDRDGG